MDKQT